MARDTNDLCLFSTVFPVFYELKMIHSVGIKNIYFFGEVSDPVCVKYFNAHTAYCNTSKNNSFKFNIVKLI
jgi:hypothetical protein